MRAAAQSFRQRALKSKLSIHKCLT